MSTSDAGKNILEGVSPLRGHPQHFVIFPQFGPQRSSPEKDGRVFPDPEATYCPEEIPSRADKTLVTLNVGTREEPLVLHFEIASRFRPVDSATATAGSFGLLGTWQSRKASGLHEISISTAHDEPFYPTLGLHPQTKQLNVRECKILSDRHEIYAVRFNTELGDQHTFWASCVVQLRSALFLHVIAQGTIEDPWPDVYLMLSSIAVSI